MAKPKKSKPEEKTAAQLILEREREKLNAIMGSSVEKAFNMAVDSGAAIANARNPKTQMANVDSLPQIQFINTENKPVAIKSETYKPYRSIAPVFARKLTQAETIEVGDQVLHGNPGDYRIIGATGAHWFATATEFKAKYEELK